MSLDEVRGHLRLDHIHEDAEINILIAAAVGYLDGWRGVLGRAIMAQTWAVSVDAAGDYVLPMPDVTSAELDGTQLAVTATAGGPCVTAAAAGTITFTCAMPPSQLAMAKAIILLLVGHWFANRDAVGQPVQEIPMSANMLIGALRRPKV